MKFVYLEHPDGAQMMFYERDGDLEAGPFEVPLGRGAILQIAVNAIPSAIVAAGIPRYVELRQKWRNWGDREGEQPEFLLQDPDGYLVMVKQRIGERTSFVASEGMQSLFVIASSFVDDESPAMCEPKTRKSYNT